MKKPLLCLIASIIMATVFGQQELIENSWTAHYMIVDNVVYDVPQPHPSFPNYDPGVIFYENSTGYNISATISYNVYFNFDPLIISSDNFIVPSAGITLGECEFYCDIEYLYLGIFGGPDPRTFLYEILDDSSGKTLIITSPEGDIAVHGNYILLSNEDFSTTTFKIFPNPVMDILNISSENSSLESYSIYTISGEKVMTQSVQGDVSIDVSNLSSGVYFFEGISTMGERGVRRFIKK